MMQMRYNTGYIKAKKWAYIRTYSIFVTTMNTITIVFDFNTFLLVNYIAKYLQIAKFLKETISTKN